MYILYNIFRKFSCEVYILILCLSVRLNMYAQHHRGLRPRCTR